MPLTAEEQREYARIAFEHRPLPVPVPPLAFDIKPLPYQPDIMFSDGTIADFKLGRHYADEQMAAYKVLINTYFVPINVSP